MRPLSALHRGVAAATVHAAPAVSTGYTSSGPRYPFEEFAATRARAAPRIPLRRAAIPVDQRYAAAAEEARRVMARASDKGHTSGAAKEPSKDAPAASVPQASASAPAETLSSPVRGSHATPGSSPLAWFREPSSHRFLRLHYPTPRVPQPAASAPPQRPERLAQKPSQFQAPPRLNLRGNTSHSSPQALLDSLNYDTDADRTLSAFTALHDEHPDLVLGATSAEALCRIASNSAGRRQSAVVERILEDMERLLDEGLSPSTATTVTQLGRAILEGASQGSESMTPEAGATRGEASRDEGALYLFGAGLVDLLSPNQVSRLFHLLQMASARLPAPGRGRKRLSALAGVEFSTARRWLAELCATQDPAMLPAIGLLERHLASIPKQTPAFPSSLEAARLIQYHLAISSFPAAASAAPLTTALKILQRTAARQPLLFDSNLMTQIELDGQLVLDAGGSSETSLKATLGSAAIRALFARGFWDEATRMADKLEATLTEEAEREVADAVLASVARDAIERAVRSHGPAKFDGIARAVNLTRRFAGPLARAQADLSCVKGFIELAEHEGRADEALRAVGALLSQSQDGKREPLPLSARLGIVEGIGAARFLSLISASVTGPNPIYAAIDLSGLTEASQDILDRIIPESLHPRAIVAFTEAGHADLARKCWEHWVALAELDDGASTIISNARCVLVLVKAFAEEGQDHSFAQRVVQAFLSSTPINALEHWALTDIAEALFVVGKPDEALRVIAQMVHRRLVPDEADLMVLMEGIARYDLDRAVELLISRIGRVFELGNDDKRRFQPSPKLFSSLIQRCIMQGRHDLAAKLLRAAQEEGVEADVGLRTLSALVPERRKASVAPASSALERRPAGGANHVIAKSLLEAHRQGWAPDPCLMHDLARRAALGERLDQPRRSTLSESEDGDKEKTVATAGKTSQSRPFHALDLRASLILHTFANRALGCVDISTTSVLLQALLRKAEWLTSGSQRTRERLSASQSVPSQIRIVDDVLEDVRVALGDKMREEKDDTPIGKRRVGPFESNWLANRLKMPDKNSMCRMLLEATSLYAELGDVQGAIECIVWLRQVSQRGPRQPEEAPKQPHLPPRLHQQLSHALGRSQLPVERIETYRLLMKGGEVDLDGIAKTKPWW